MNKNTILALAIFIILFAPAFATLNPVSLPYLTKKDFDGRNLKIENILDKNQYYTKFYITYMSGNLKISGIMDVPEGSDPFPAVITCHGYIDTRYYTNGRGLKREQDYLAKHGYIVLHPDYRNHNGSDKDPDNNLHLNLGYTEDVINAILALKKSGIKVLDNEKIGLLGHSLGGGVALNIMVTKPELVQAYILFAPISSDYKDNYQRWILGHREAKFGRPETTREIIETYGSPESNPEFWNNISAKSFLANITAPIMLHQGLADKSVPPEWSKSLYESLKALNKDITFYSYPGEPHEFINAWPTVMKRSVKFFDRYLK